VRGLSSIPIRPKNSSDNSGKAFSSRVPSAACLPAGMKRAGKHSKGGFLLGVIRAGAFYLFRYIKHAIRNEIVFV